MVSLAGLYQNLAPISWPLWSPLGNICAADYGNFILGDFFSCWSSNPPDIYVPFPVISAVYWSCLVFLALLFSVIERCFLGYSLHQFWISWKRPADFRAHQPGPLIIHSDAVHEVHVDTSIYGVINFLRLLKPWKAWKVRGCINKSSQTHLKSFSTPLLATAGLE